MAVYIRDMYKVKDWNREEVAALTALAKQKGISKKELAEVWLDIHPTMLSYWMTDKKSYREPNGQHRRLLTLTEKEIKRLGDRP